MTLALWWTIAGVLLLTMALAASLLKRLPLSSAMLYLVVGFVLGPAALGLLDGGPIERAPVYELLAEIAVVISLFIAGMKLSLPMRDRRWRLPVLLATVSMLVTIVLVAAVSMAVVGLSLGAAVLLGAILAPTDPVLASDVQLEDPSDRDRVRFALTGEGGLNDGTAFPFVYLGLGLLGLHELGTAGWRWVAVDLLWGVGGGLAIGAALGFAVSKLVLYLRVNHREAVGLDEFLALGLIALSYGVALLADALAFLSVFAAGLALRRIDPEPSDKRLLHDALRDASAGSRRERPSDAKPEEIVASQPEHAGAYMTQAVLGFNQQLERIGEVAVVIAVGAMLHVIESVTGPLWIVAALLLLIRPLAVWIGVLGSGASTMERGMIAWFGIRGIGSIYYLMFAINQGLPRPLAEQLVAITLMVVSVSIVVHGISVTPLMKIYSHRRAASEAQAARRHPR